MNLKPLFHLQYYLNNFTADKMAKPGDTVRYLNATGGGRIVRIVGKTAYVEEDGFEMPVLLKDIVVVMGAGQEPSPTGPRLVFDQQAFDAARHPDPAPKKEEPAPAAPLPPAEETDHGEQISLTLAFEPSDLKRISASTFAAVLVNDSNYTLLFQLARRGSDDRQWTTVYSGVAEPNELIDLANITAGQLPAYERVALQYVAYKPSKPFELKAPGSLVHRLDLTKFYKVHCFRPSVYFSTPVLEVPLVTADRPVRKLALTPDPVVADNSVPDKRMMRELKDKYKVERVKGKPHETPASAHVSPHKLLPLVEVDLHMSALTDTLAGMTNADMLRMQLDEVRSVMRAHARRIGQKIVFIHGKGDGVLRKAVIDLLRREYPKAEIQDASFAQYGFGASLITIH